MGGGILHEFDFEIKKYHMNEGHSSLTELLTGSSG
jgi:hypothetical protein